MIIYFENEKVTKVNHYTITITKSEMIVLIDMMGLSYCDKHLINHYRILEIQPENRKIRVFKTSVLVSSAPLRDNQRIIYFDILRNCL